MNRRFFTPSMGVACLALAVALSGTAYAVSRLPANSVGTKQVINRSLQRVDLKPGALLAGPRGPKGHPGAAGPAGPAGSAGPKGIPIGSVSLREKTEAVSPTASVDTTVTTTCPEGTQVLYGGFMTNVPVYVLSNVGISGQNWRVVVRSTGVGGIVTVWSACVNTT